MPSLCYPSTVKLLRRQFPHLLAATIVSSVLLLVAGCSSGTSSEPPVTTPPVIPPPVTTYAGTAFSGKVLAGAKPIVGATVQVYSAGTTGASSQATLLGSTLFTDANGAFTVPAGYPCPASSSLVYAVARGGAVGTATANAAIVLLTPLGACNQIASEYVLNEVTTAASAWALSQFLTAGANIAATSTNSRGILNAFATAANLANPATGASPGSTFVSADKSPVAVQKINSIASLLNTCTTSAAACNSLFTAAAPAGASTPANTLDAALNIVHNPGNNVATLYTQSATSTAFAPALTAAPADWTLYINYSGGGLAEPTALGIDSTGAVWVADYPGASQMDNTAPMTGASKFNPNGTPVFANGITGYGFDESYGLAIDTSDNVWITNEESPHSINNGLGTVTALNSSGQPVSGATGYSSGGLNFPLAVAIDTNATVWAVNTGNSHVTLLSSSGAPLSGATGYTGPSIAFPVSVAVDANHNGWIGNQGDSYVTKISPTGQSTAFSCCNGPAGLAIDQSGNLWAANYYGDSVTQINTTSGSVITTINGGGIYHPQGIAVDGSSNIWVASFRNPNPLQNNSVISQIAGATSSTPGRILSPSTGFATDAKLLEVYALAIDASGNLWATNLGSDILTEFVGLAAPVKTPLIGPPQAP